jgi:predicted RNase H-like HicB family nuclease
MCYPILIESGYADMAFGVVVPDLPGCFSAGDTLDEAIDAAKEAAETWIDAAFDDGTPIPPPSDLETVRSLPDHTGWAVGLVERDKVLFDDTIERINITSPKRALPRLDDLAKAEGKAVAD